MDDFRTHRSFPGLEGGPFEILVVIGERLERIPAVLFTGGLLLVSYAVSLADLRRAVILASFVLGDWLLLTLLPRLQISFGPAKGPTLALALLRAPAGFLPLPVSLAAQGLGTGLVIYGFFVEPQRLGLSREILHTPKWGGARPLRIIHFGDLHMDRPTRLHGRLVEIIRQERPDLILISGDYLSYSNVYDPEAWDAAREVLMGLEAPLGVFAVSGSPPVDPEEALSAIFEGTHVRWLRDEIVSLRLGSSEFDLVGVSCTHKPFIDGPRLAALLPSKPARLTLLLYHSPDLAPEAAERGIDLQLSGHTHGGQVRIPFYGALYPSSLYGKRFEVGRRQVGAMTLYVTRGLGLEGKGAPRVRFLSPPELVLWEISGPEE